MSVVSRGRADRVRIGFVCVCVVRRCTKYRSGYSEAAAPVKFFWRVLESYDDEMQVRHCVPLRSLHCLSPSFTASHRGSAAIQNPKTLS